MRDKLNAIARCLAGITFLAINVTASPAAADYRVSYSNFSRYSAGQKLGENTRLRLPSSGRLRLSRKGSTHLLKGPYSGTFAEYAKKKGSSIVPRERGLTPGATRGKKP